MKLFFLFFLLILSIIGLAYLDLSPTGHATQAFQMSSNCKYLDATHNCYWTIKQRGSNCEPAESIVPENTPVCQDLLD